MTVPYTWLARHIRRGDAVNVRPQFVRMLQAVSYRVGNPLAVEHSRQRTRRPICVVRCRAAP